jgi:hypothetical protein
MEVRDSSACLIGPGHSGIGGVQDSTDRTNGKSAARSWENNSFYRLIEEQSGPIRPGISASCNCASSIKNASGNETGVLIEEKHIISAALVSIEMEIMKIPTDSTVSRIANQRLKDRILSRNKSRGCVQHLSARESATKESTLTDLPRRSRVSGEKDIL